jgi:DNA adenine methylase
MTTSSPLRYPGGKSSMTDLLSSIRRLNSLGSLNIAEPFAGGAGASLSLLYREETQAITINDADKSIFSFWWSLLKKTDDFISLIKRKRVSIAEWHRQRSVYLQAPRIKRLDLGFAAFYLNRCNRSGIIMNGGPIGGIDQEGDWKIDARFNKTTLIERCKKVGEYSDRIQASNLDGIDFIQQKSDGAHLFFIDPPYYKKGPLLYLNGLDPQYHKHLADQLSTMSNDAWVLTYDDCKEIRHLYRGWATVRPFSLRYAAAERRKGREVLITPRWMRLPKHQGSAALGW